jgi:hypothetical protein
MLLQTILMSDRDKGNKMRKKDSIMKNLNKREMIMMIQMKGHKKKDNGKKSNLSHLILLKYHMLYV